MKKKVIALMLAAGMTFSMPAAAAEVSLEERVAALEARVAELEILLGLVSSVEVETVEAETELVTVAAEGTDEIVLFDEPYTLEVGIGTVMRETAEEKGKLITKLRVGNEVTVLGGSEAWLQIEFDGKTGYVNRSLMEQ